MYSKHTNNTNYYVNSNETYIHWTIQITIITGELCYVSGLHIIGHYVLPFHINSFTVHYIQVIDNSHIKVSPFPSVGIMQARQQETCDISRWHTFKIFLH